MNPILAASLAGLLGLAALPAAAKTAHLRVCSQLGDDGVSRPALRVTLDNATTTYLIDQRGLTRTIVHSRSYATSWIRQVLGDPTLGVDYRNDCTDPSRPRHPPPPPPPGPGTKAPAQNPPPPPAPPAPVPTPPKPPVVVVPPDDTECPPEECEPS